MASSTILCALCGLVIAAVTNLNGVNGENSECSNSEFWSSDMDRCIPCSTCQKFPKMPSCNTCTKEESPHLVWRLLAITSFSVLAIVLVTVVLIVGVMVHRRKVQKRPLREPVEETTGPLFQA